MLLHSNKYSKAKRNIWSSYACDTELPEKKKVHKTLQPNETSVVLHQQVYTLLFRFFMLFNLLPGLDKLKSTKVQKLQ